MQSQPSLGYAPILGWSQLCGDTQYEQFFLVVFTRFICSEVD